MLKLTSLLLLLAGTLVGAYYETSRIVPSLVPDRIIEVAGVACNSGLVYVPDRGALLGVGDSGQVTLIGLDGQILDQRTYYEPRESGKEPRDFEAVTLGPEPGYAWLLDEANRHLVELRIDDLSLGREISLDAEVLPSASHNKQFEGLARTDNGDWVLAHEALPTALLLCEPGGHCPGPVRILDAPSVSDVIVGERRELLLISREYGLRLVPSVESRESSWRLVLGGSNVEGGALVPGFGLVLTEDREPTRLLLFTRLTSWEHVRQALLD